MSRSFFILCCCLFLLSVLHACTRKQPIPLTNLTGIELLMESRADSARILLDRFEQAHPTGNDGLDRFNRAFYYLLRVQEASKAGEKVYMLDTLLNYSLKEFARVKDKKRLAQALILKGESWEELNEPREATECYLQALQMVEGSRNYTQMLHAYSSLGYIYSKQNLLDEAFKTFRSCYEAILADTCERSKFISLQNIGVIHFYYESPDSAFYYFERAVQHAEKSKDSVELKDIAYSNFSYYYKEEEKYEKALSYLNKISNMTGKSYLIKGGIYFSLQQYDSASYYMQQTIRSDDLYARMGAYEELSELEEELGNYKNALFYLDQYVEIQDSLTESTHTSEIHAINHKHNIRKEIHKIENKHRFRMTILISLSIITLLLVTTIAILKSRKRKMKQAQEIACKEKEISDLQSQMASTRNTILRLKYEHEQTAGLQQQIVEQENSLQELQNQLNQLRIHLFMEAPVYKKIQKLAVQEEQESVTILPAKEREELKNIVHKIYTDLNRELNTLCPSLAEEDILFCCLAKLGFSLPLIAVCTGYARIESARQRRFRIKKKMTEETQSEELYLSFFK